MSLRPRCPAPFALPFAPALPLALAALAALLLPSCKVPDAYVYNLREVRDPDGSAKRVGAPMNTIEYYMRTYVFASMSMGDLDLATKEPDSIDDPDEIALENVNALRRCDSEDPWVRGLQIEMYTWLAIDDGYSLVRERAVKELGRLGLAIGVEAPVQPEKDATFATPDDLVGPIADLVRVTRPYLETGADPGPELAATCAEIEALPLDRDGARRVLATANALLHRGKLDAPELAPLAELHAFAARRAVSLALGAALLDSNERVRAAAIAAGAKVTHNGLAGTRLRALGDSSPIVLSSVMLAIAQAGLPNPEQDLAADEEWAYRAAWISRMVAHADDPRTEVSYAACRALMRVSGAGLTTLRWEDWSQWWEQEVRIREQAEQEAKEEAQAPPEAAPKPEEPPAAGEKSP